MIRLCLAFTLLLSFCWPTSAQNLDTLWTVWNDESQPDSVRLAAIYDFAWDKFMYSDPDSTFALAEIQRQYAKEKGLTIWEARALNAQATSCKVRSDLMKALRLYKEALVLQEEVGEPSGIATGIHNVALVYQELGDIPKALELYLTSMKMREEVGDMRQIGDSYNNLGGIYHSQGDTGKSIEFYTKALEAHRKGGNKVAISRAYYNLGVVSEMSGYYEEAREYQLKAIEIREELGIRQGVGYGYLSLGVISKKTNQMDSAIAYYNRAGEILDGLGDSRGMSAVCGNLAALYRKLDNNDLALEYGKKALAYAEESENPERVMTAADVLQAVYLQVGDAENAYKYLLLHIEMKDSINNDDNLTAAIRSQYKYESIKQTVADSLKHQLDKERIEIENQAKLDHERDQKYILYGGMGFLLLLGISLFRSYKQQQRANQVIAKQKDEVEHQRNEAQYQKELVEERNKEIMDSIVYAQRIQAAILPSSEEFKMLLPESFVLYKPKDIVAGDFYWIDQVGENIVFAAADCTGHGVPGAMVSVVCHTALKRAVREYGLTEPNAILDKVREIVIEQFSKKVETQGQDNTLRAAETLVKDGMDIALCSFNKQSMKLSFSGANQQLYVIRDGELAEYRSDRQPIGMYRVMKPFTQQEIQLKEGDDLYIFSDGYADQFGGLQGKKFKYKQFKDMFLTVHSLAMSKQAGRIDQIFEDWRGSYEQIDDVCVIGVRV